MVAFIHTSTSLDQKSSELGQVFSNSIEKKIKPKNKTEYLFDKKNCSCTYMRGGGKFKT